MDAVFSQGLAANETCRLDLQTRRGTEHCNGTTADMVVGGMSGGERPALLIAQEVALQGSAVSSPGKTSCELASPSVDIVYHNT